MYEIAPEGVCRISAEAAALKRRRLSEMSREFTVELPRNPKAPGLAREALEGLAGELDPGAAADVRLLISELVTNSVKYGGEGPVMLELSASAGKLRAEIVDQGAGFVPRTRDRGLEDVGGWGLHLVEELTDRWGTHTGSTHVWFEIDLD
jgi:anti-sigma regulatory factor (Ser/Thr protein kinase)